jgi:hypothetical protein
VLAANHPADPPELAALAAPVPLPAPNAPDAVLLLLLPPTLYPAGPAWLLPVLLPAVALLPPEARDVPGPLPPASRPAAVLLLPPLLPALASARASTGFLRPLRSALTAAHSAVNLRHSQT